MSTLASVGAGLKFSPSVNHQPPPLILASEWHHIVGRQMPVTVDQPPIPKDNPLNSLLAYYAIVEEQDEDSSRGFVFCGHASIGESPGEEEIADALKQARRMALRGTGIEYTEDDDANTVTQIKPAKQAKGEDVENCN